MHSSFTMLPSLYFNSYIPRVQPGWHVQSFWWKHKPNQQAKRTLGVSNRLTSNSFYSHWDKTIAKELYKTQNKRDFNNSVEDYFTPTQCSYIYNQQKFGAQYYLTLLVGCFQIQKCIRKNNNNPQVPFALLEILLSTFKNFAHWCFLSLRIWSAWRDKLQIHLQKDCFLS